MSLILALVSLHPFWQIQASLSVAGPTNNRVQRPEGPRPYILKVKKSSDFTFQSKKIRFEVNNVMSLILALVSLLSFWEDRTLMTA